VCGTKYIYFTLAAQLTKRPVQIAFCHKVVKVDSRSPSRFLANEPPPRSIRIARNRRTPSRPVVDCRLALCTCNGRACTLCSLYIIPSVHHFRPIVRRSAYDLPPLLSCACGGRSLNLAASDGLRLLPSV
jgi:hypothetical protein